MVKHSDPANGNTKWKLGLQKRVNGLSDIIGIINIQENPIIIYKQWTYSIVILLSFIDIILNKND